MKKQFVLLFAAVLLCSCGKNDFVNVSKASDFIDYATYVETTISSLNVYGKGTSLGVAGHNASFYTNNDFSYKNGNDDVTGYTYKTESTTQQWRIVGKAAYLCLDTTKLNQSRQAAKTLVQNDYEKVCQGYEAAKALAGKTAAELNYKSFFFARSINGDVAGYTLKYTVETAKDTTLEVHKNWTLDYYGGKWVFSYFVDRETTVAPDAAHPGTYTTTYDLAEYSFVHTTSLTPISFNLSSCTSISVDGFNTGNIDFENGVPLSTK